MTSSPLFDSDTVRTARRVGIISAGMLGFTLIELLVVIAIIGILASLVLTSLASARNKGRDTRVISDVNQVRSQIESEASVQGPYYSGASYCVTALSTINSSSGNCKTLASDAAGQGGAINVVTSALSGTNFSSFAVYGKLVTDATKYFCVDSTGKVNPLAAANTTVACP